MTERRKNQSEEWTYFTLLFIYFITVNKYRFCISVIGYINVQIIGIVSVIKTQYRSITNYKHVCNYYVFANIVSYFTVKIGLNFLRHYFYIIVYRTYNHHHVMQHVEIDFTHFSLEL